MKDAAAGKVFVFSLDGMVFFPTTSIPLNIFEPRYVEMVNDALATGSRPAPGAIRHAAHVEPRPPPPYTSTMSTTPKPRPSGRANKPRAKAKPAANLYPYLNAADRKLIEKLVRKGLLIVGPDAGKPLADDDPILQPGPPCPGAVEALLEDRYGP